MSGDAISRAGGPAFPVSIPGVGDNGWHGMTLRDFYAAVALHAVVAAYPNAGADGQVVRAFQLADAMLAKRGTP